MGRDPGSEWEVVTELFTCPGHSVYTQGMQQCDCIYLFIIPRNEVDVCRSVRPFPSPSVDARISKMVQSHNCFFFTPIITKLHIQTPDKSRMYLSYFWVNRSKVKVPMP